MRPGVTHPMHPRCTEQNVLLRRLSTSMSRSTRFVLRRERSGPAPCLVDRGRGGGHRLVSCARRCMRQEEARSTYPGRRDRRPSRPNPRRESSERATRLIDRARKGGSSPCLVRPKVHEATERLAVPSQVVETEAAFVRSPKGENEEGLPVPFAEKTVARRLAQRIRRRDRQGFGRFFPRQART